MTLTARIHQVISMRFPTMQPWSFRRRQKIISARVVTNSITGAKVFGCLKASAAPGDSEGKFSHADESARFHSISASKFIQYPD